MAEVIVTRRERFSAAHRLHNPNWSAEQNQKVFGLCNNPSGHGHNYVLEVMVKGTPDPETGYVIDLKLLSDIIREEIISQVDHKHLNHDVDFLQGINPTVENLAIAFYQRLRPRLAGPNYRLYGVRVFETENNFGEYFGE